MLYLKYVCLLFGIFYAFSNTGRAFRGDGVSGINIFFMSLAISGYCLLEFGLGY